MLCDKGPPPFKSRMIGLLMCRAWMAPLSTENAPIWSLLKAIYCVVVSAADWVDVNAPTWLVVIAAKSAVVMATIWLVVSAAMSAVVIATD